MNDVFVKIQEEIEEHKEKLVEFEKDLNVRQEESIENSKKKLPLDIASVQKQAD